MTDSAPSGGLGVLDLIVLIAMAVTAVAFAAGLHIQGGLPLLASVIAAAALYLVAVASYLFIARSQGTDTGRLDQFEGALEILDSGLQRIDRVEDDIARLGQAVTNLPGTRIEELASELERVHSRIEGLRSDLQMETRSQREKITKDLGMLEDLIKQLAHDLTGGAVSASSAAALAAIPERGASAEREDESAASGEDLVIDEEIEEAIAAVADILDGGEGADVDTETVVRVTETVEIESVQISETTGAAATASEAESGMIGTLQQAIEAGRVDLYVQPIVALPARKVRYYESVTRVRDAADELILPSAYIQEAENAGIMPLIDNVLLVKSAQLLRRQQHESKIKGAFCSISVQSLLDPEYFPELVVFLEENSGLSDNLIFELRQRDIMGLTRGELGALDTLGALGFNFSLDHVVDLDIDYIELSDRYFRFLKLDAATFLEGLAEKGAPLPPADMARYLEGFGLQLIVGEVERETTVARLIDAGVELAQGGLFGEPKPATPSSFQELEATGAE